MVSRLSAIFIVMITVASASCGCSPSIAGTPNLDAFQKVANAYFESGFNDDAVKDYRNASAGDKQAKRNEIVLNGMGAIDIRYAEFSADLTREGQGVPFAATLASLSLSGAGTLVGSATAKTALAAVDTGLKGAKAAYDTNILSQKTIQFLQKQMSANRNIVRTRIVSKLALGIDRYPLELAMIDLQDYASAGTISAGLVGIDAQTSQTLAETQSNAVTEILTYGADDTTAAIRAYVASGGASAKAALAAWLKREGTDEFHFYNTADYAASRRQFLASITPQARK